MTKINSEEIVIVVPINAKAETREIVYDKLVALATQTRKEDGNQFYRVHIVSEEKNSFLIYEKWRNQNALDYHMNQPYLKSFLEESVDLLSEEIKGTICQEIEIS